MKNHSFGGVSIDPHPLGDTGDPHVCMSVAALRRRLEGNEHMLDEAADLMRAWGAVIITRRGRRISVRGALKG